jgi:hypothetical protein
VAGSKSKPALGPFVCDLVLLAEGIAKPADCARIERSGGSSPKLCSENRAKKIGNRFFMVGVKSTRASRRVQQALCEPFVSPMANCGMRHSRKARSWPPRKQLLVTSPIAAHLGGQPPGEPAAGSALSAECHYETKAGSVRPGSEFDEPFLREPACTLQCVLPRLHIASGETTLAVIRASCR